MGAARVVKVAEVELSRHSHTTPLESSSPVRKGADTLTTMRDVGDAGTSAVESAVTSIAASTTSARAGDSATPPPTSTWTPQHGACRRRVSARTPAPTSLALSTPNVANHGTQVGRIDAGEG